MPKLTGQRRRAAGRGFTLVELLLATVLLLLLIGAVVFSFAPLQRGAALDEGAAQFEGLLRFARAHAAQSGRQVQIQFDELVDEDFWMSLGGLRVVWEPDPLGAPGVFVELTEAAPFVRGLTDLVAVENVRPVDPETEGDEEGVGEPSVPEGELEDWFEVFPPIAFFPDGSSDSAEITLVSQSDDDPRRVAVRLVGITGAIQRWLVEPAAEGETEADTGEPQGSPPSGSSAKSAPPGARPTAATPSPVAPGETE